MNPGQRRFFLPAHAPYRPRVRRPQPAPVRLHHNSMPVAVALIAGLALFQSAPAEDFRPAKLHSTITRVQPMTGLVMWESSKNSRSDAIQLEYSYMRYNDVVIRQGEYNWSRLEEKLK